MEEAARLCDRLAVLDHGKVIAEGAPAALVAPHGADQIVQVTLAGDGEPPLARLRALPGVRTVETRGGAAPSAAAGEEGTANGDDGAGTEPSPPRIVLSVSDIATALPALLQALAAEGRTLTALTTHQATLEDVFVKLTGRGLRDA
jgi:ABC-2 type transport system ATP-binding protein